MNPTMNVHTLPTGYLFTDKYSRGELETLSIGDYGKHFNVKADFLGFKREIHGVPNTECMPLSEKWVITISTQYGCPMRCNFCDVPNIPFRGNASFDDMKAQLYNAIGLFPGVKYTERLNLHFARMGDPIFNEAVFEFAWWMHEHKDQIRLDTGLRIEVLHPVLTTSLPRKLGKLRARLLQWCQIKNEVYNGQAGLQLSINSTSEAQRSVMFGDQQMHLEDVAAIMAYAPDPISRKYCINMAFASGNECDAEKMARLFPPDRFMVKITPIHNNNACTENGVSTVGGYDSFTPYAEPEAAFKAAGYDTLVFVPSLDEEQGLVTCGNLILGGSKLKTSQSELRIRGIGDTV